MRFHRLSVALLLFAAAAAHAQRQYVSDELVITMRTGPSTQNAIIRNLRAGQALEVLEEQPGADGYAHVRLVDTDVDGWVLKQYLTATPIAKDRLVAAERELASARERATGLETQVQTLTAELEQTRAQLGDSQAKTADVSSELEDIRQASANAVELRDTNETLRRRVNQLTTQIDQMTMENAELSSRSRQNWFIVGAGVLFGGIIIGLIAPSLRRRRRSSW